jgi:hypothetical protein
MSEYPRLTDPPAIQLVVSQAILGIRWVIIMSFHDPETESKLQDV